MNDATPTIARWAPAPATGPVSCTDWCIHRDDGHADEPFAQDQRCESAPVTITSQSALNPQTLDVYLMLSAPASGAGVARLHIDSGDEEVLALKPAEARMLGALLIELGSIGCA